MLKKLFILFVSFHLVSCASYYTKNIEFNQNFEQENYSKASEILQSDKKAEDRKTKLLFYLNMGTTFHHLEQYDESNKYFEKAYIFLEDYTKNYGAKAASFLLNPNVEYYTGEEHEKLLINYYKALNYLHMNLYDEALVEVRRMNLRLNQLNDKFKGKNKYQKDAFIHLLMGVVYDVNKEYNNAFIAYRNAHEIYEVEYKAAFGFGTPTQLKKDLIRTARLSGMDDLLYSYEQKFGMKYKKEDGDANLFFLWHNGLGPVKEEWSITFTLVHGHGGNITFVNDKLGMSFTFPTSSYSSSGADFSDIQVIRIVLPKYVERALYYSSGSVKIGNRTKDLNKIEDINKVAFKVLDDRMLKELAEELIRVAIKQAIAESARKENGNVGAALSILNAVTQKADTRNWQTIPHTIYYTRFNLKAGEHQITLNQKTDKGAIKKEVFTEKITKGRNKVLTHSTLSYKQ